MYRYGIVGIDGQPGVRSAAAARDKFGKDYIGYEEGEDAKGHKKRQKLLESRSIAFAERANQHSSY